jgi:amino acid transporter
MFEKFRRRNRDGVDGDAAERGSEVDSAERGTDFQRGDGYADDGSGQTASRTTVMDRPRAAGTHTAPTAATSAAAAPGTVEEARAMQRDRFGGADGTAIFFGWLSAFGLAALLLAVVAAAGTRIGFTNNVSTQDATGTIGIVGAAILVVILLISYLGGGYAAGRIARFDGARQGLRVWLLGLLVTIAAAVAGWIGGSQYNIYEQLNLPRIPVDEGDIATLAIVTLAVVLLGTLVAAIAGGKAGERYHARVDAMAWDRDRV